jgi:hypothetical protein
MKKIFITFFVCLISFVSVSAKTNFGDVITDAGGTLSAAVDTIYHDGKAAVSTLYTDLKAGTSELYPDVKAAVIEIAKAIGVGAEHLYTVLVRNYIVIGVKELLVFVGGLIALIIGICWFAKLAKSQITFLVVAPIFLLILGLSFITGVDYEAMLMGIINPEWGAINYILDFTKDIIK